jgi:hypothetical protein
MSDIKEALTKFLLDQVDSTTTTTTPSGPDSCPVSPVITPYKKEKSKILFSDRRQKQPEPQKNSEPVDTLSQFIHRGFQTLIANSCWKREDE